MEYLDQPLLGAVLRQRRRERGLSLRDLEQMVGVSFSVLSRIEHGSQASLRNYQLVRSWLDSTEDEGLQPVLDSGGAPSMRASVVLSNEIVEDLRFIMHINNVHVSSAIARAIEVAAYVEKEMDKGSGLAFIRPDGQLVEVVLP